ncbi:DUF6113 family protein [Streptomyces sp. CNQ085]|uniref:DUF6113 family protein n=1 Tax=Streptomyces sp. CNQ085 TaxID=2886944 RepID=UPI001F50FB3A|nr:DUF6113 family protein [Streptomyces sp. CNQ085]MCI0385241.1 DUF6113 family protein [Streptomyces sp. CNQ085]
MRARGARVAVYAALAVLGAVVAVAGTLVQAGWFPLGVLLALGGAVALFLGGARLTGTRIGAAAPAGGWTLVVLLLTTSRPEGDFVFGTGGGTYFFLLGGMLAAVACATVAPLGDFPPADLVKGR